MDYSRMSNFFIVKKKIFGEFTDQNKLEQAQYTFQVIMINLEKMLIVYSLSILFSVFINTLMMHVAYLLIRRFAGGWHAMRSLNCTIFSTFGFVFIPWLIKTCAIQYSYTVLVVLSIVILIVIGKYSPADTEKNPLVSISERKSMRKKAIFVTILSLITLLLVQNQQIQINLLTGVMFEAITIHPVFYKLTKRSYNNYEQYKATE